MRVPNDGPGACHAVHAQRHLGKWCDKVGVASIEKRKNDKERGIHNMKTKS